MAAGAGRDITVRLRIDTTQALAAILEVQRRLTNLNIPGGGGGGGGGVGGGGGGGGRGRGPGARLGARIGLSPVGMAAVGVVGGAVAATTGPLIADLLKGLQQYSSSVFQGGLAEYAPGALQAIQAPGQAGKAIEETRKVFGALAGHGFGPPTPEQALSVFGAFETRERRIREGVNAVDRAVFGRVTGEARSIFEHYRSNAEYLFRDEIRTFRNEIKALRGLIPGLGW